MKFWYAFGLGVAATASLAWAHGWSINNNWEVDAYEHGYGWYEVEMAHPHVWKFHWKDELPSKPVTTKIRGIKV